MTRGRTERIGTEQSWTPEERRAITVLLSRGLISSSSPVTRTDQTLPRQHQRAG